MQKYRKQKVAMHVHVSGIEIDDMQTWLKLSEDEKYSYLGV